MRTDRIEARVAPERAQRIRFAADLSDTSMSAFVVDAASERAERVIAEHRETVLPSDFFDDVLAALDEPAPAVAPALAKASSTARRSVTRR